MIKRPILIAAGLWLSQHALATCYAVYAGDRLVYRSVASPVDLSHPLHETVPARFGRGATMMFTPSSEGCTTVDASAPPSPLLTNEEGARPARARGAGRQGRPIDLDRYFNDRRAKSG
jgi:hypothetical protein